MNASRTRWVTCLLAVVALAAGLRFPHLNRRPMHVDEAVHAYKLDELYRTGRYVYDLHEFHGPTLYYAAIPALWLSGASDWTDISAATLRIVPVIFSLLLLLTPLLLLRDLGHWPVVIAALLTAISPALTFFSGYYIQETLLVCFTFTWLAASWRWYRARHLTWALLAGLALGLMHATKETWIIAAGGGAVALLVDVWRHKPTRRHGWHLPIALGVAAVVATAFFSAFGTNWQGPLDSLRAFTIYFDRAGEGGIHEHPWWYYWRMLLYAHYAPGPVWSEALIVLLGLAGGFIALLQRPIPGVCPRLARFLAVYTLATAAIYTVLPYKTPWCALTFLHGFTLLAGLATVWLLAAIRVRPAQVAVGGLLLLLAAQLVLQNRRTTGRFDADPRNPYVYAATGHKVTALAEYTAALAAATDRPLVIKVIAHNEWPLPWYLRHHAYVGYYNGPPADPDADLVLVGQDFAEPIAATLAGDYAPPSYYGVRRDETYYLYVATAVRIRFEQANSP
jgi:uncharacterized protein (TIGR03663 family)